MFFVKQQTNWREKKLKGKVKEIEKVFNEVTKDYKKITESERYLRTEERAILKFDSFGNLLIVDKTSEILENNSSKIYSSQHNYKYNNNLLIESQEKGFGLKKYFYDSDLRLIEVQDCYSDGRVSCKFQFKYNSENNLDTEEKSDEKGIVYKKSYYYDVNNNLIRIATLAGNGKKIIEKIFEYDKFRNVIKEKEVWPFNRETITTYQYNNNLDISVKDNYIYYKYQYDATGNWIKKVECRKQGLLQKLFKFNFKTFIPINVTTRKIIYYKN